MSTARKTAAKAAPVAAWVELTGAQALARLLIQAGVTEVFGLAGGKFSPFYKALSESPQLRYVGVRHEATGAFMASGAVARSGRLAVCLGETTPGGLNLVSSVGVAFANCLPLLAITSDHVRALSAPSRGAFSSGDNCALFRSITKASARVTDPRRIPELVRWALRAALTGRPGPVHLDIPTDVLGAVARYGRVELEAPLASFSALTRGLADPAEVARAADLLVGAKRPLLLAGGGAVASGATATFRALKRALGALAISTQMGLGVVPSTDPDFVGQGGLIGGEASLKALREADVILAVGCRFSSWMWTDGAPNWRDDQDRKLIQIDIDPAAMGINEPLSVALPGDADAVLGQLLAALDGRTRKAGAWEGEVVAARAAYLARLRAAEGEGGEIMHPAALAREVGGFIGEQGLVVFDGGHTTFWSNEFTPTVAPRTRFHDPGMSHLGFGTPWAMAMKAMEPDQAVFQITGDGAFGFTLQELDTARRHGLNVVTIVHNNAAFGVIGFSQGRSGFQYGVELAGTDYAAIARGFGCHGERVTRLEEVGPALQRAVESGLPAVIDAVTRFTPHPMLPVFGKSSSTPPPDYLE